MTCDVGYCDRIAGWKIENVGTGNRLVMCDFHKGTYDHAPMRVVERIEKKESK